MHLDSPRGPKPQRGHYLPVSIYGNHLGNLCIIVPRPDRRSMYNKLFFSAEQLREAAAKVAEAKAERAKKHGETVEEPSPGAPPPEPQGLEDFETPPAHARAPVRLRLRVGEERTRSCSRTRSRRARRSATGRDGGRGAEAGRRGRGEQDCRRGQDGGRGRARARRRRARRGHGQERRRPRLRLLLEGVDGSTGPDIDQRATAELRARLDEYTPPEQRTRRNTLQFDSAEHMFEVHVAEGEHARAELDAQLDHTVTVVSKLESLHEADSKTLQDLYEHDILANNEKLAREVARDQKRREREAAKKAAGESTGGNRRKARVVKSGGVRSSGYGQ